MQTATQTTIRTEDMSIVRRQIKALSEATGVELTPELVKRRRGLGGGYTIKTGTRAAVEQMLDADINGRHRAAALFFGLNIPETAS